MNLTYRYILKMYVHAKNEV